MLTSVQSARPQAIRFGHPLALQPDNVAPLFGHGPERLQNGDSIHFGARRNLLKEYGIDLRKVDVQFSKPGMTLAVPKRVAMEKAVQAWEHGNKNALKGNQSGRFYVTNAHLQTGTWGLGTNIEMDLANDILLCGERSAVVRAFNNELEKHPRADFQDEAKLAQIKDAMKVDFMVLSSGHKAFGEDPAAGSPCSECQSWIDTDEYFSPETQIASVIKDPEKEGHWILRVNEARDFLPLSASKTASVTNSGMGVFGLPFDFSDKAKDRLAELGIQESEFKSTAHRLLNKAWEAYRNEPTENLSNQRYAVSALFPDGKMYAEARVDLNPRWPAINPDLVVLAKGVRGSLQAGIENPQVDALAFWGDVAKPSTQNVGKLAQKQGGNPHALVVVIENNRIQVRTLLDYMTEIYVSGGGTYGGIKRQLDTHA